MIAPTIIQFDGTLLCGASAPMTLRTFTPWTLWPKVMPQLSRVSNRKNKDLISLRSFEGIPVFGPTADPISPIGAVQKLRVLTKDSSTWKFRQEPMPFFITKD